jgi:beta-N-acetylhexosaminidase
LDSVRPLLLCVAAAVAVSCANPGPSTSGATAAPSGAAITASPVASGAAAACADTKLAGMAEEQRVGQLFMVGINGDRLSVVEAAAIEADHFGSVFLVGTRTNGVAGVRNLSDSIQALATDSGTAGVRFFVAADQEGGQVQRLGGSGFTTIPSALEQGRLPTATLQADAQTWGDELAAAGINLDLAPVMDIVPAGDESSNGPIGALQREFGNDPATVGGHGAAVVRGMAQAGIATALKHFLGLGRVIGNTDTSAGVVDSATTASDPYLAAFGDGIAAGAPFVMVSLATYTQIDAVHQAVFSPEVIGTLLRGRLGFDGVVISDDIGATRAVASMAPGDRATAFMSAGGDMMIVSGLLAAGEMASAVLARARSDSSFGALVDAAALRVLKTKATYGLVTCG